MKNTKIKSAQRSNTRLVQKQALKLGIYRKHRLTNQKYLDIKYVSMNEDQKYDLCVSALKDNIPNDDPFQVLSIENQNGIKQDVRVYFSKEGILAFIQSYEKSKSEKQTQQQQA